MDNKKKMSATEIIVAFLLYIMATFLSAFTTAYLWNNIVSQILGITTVTLVQALALDFFWVYFSSQSVLGDIKDEIVEAEHPVVKAIKGILKMLLYLAFGYVITKFI